MNLIDYLKTLDPNVPLVEYNHSLLCFCHNNVECRLIQPNMVRLNDKQELGASNIQTILEYKGKQVTFDKTINYCIKYFYE